MHPTFRPFALLAHHARSGHRDARTPRRPRRTRPAAAAPAVPGSPRPSSSSATRSAPTTCSPNYTKFTDYVRKLDAESDRMVGAEHRQDRRGARPVDGDHHRARRTSRSSTATARSPRACRRPRDSPTTRRARWRVRARRWSGSTAACTRPRCSGAQQLIETIYQFVSRTDEETHAHPARRRHPRGPRQSRRDGAGLRLVHAQARSEAAQHRRACRGSTRSTSGTTTTATST